jgi:RND family efflux transporter MFP subunit
MSPSSSSRWVVPVVIGVLGAAAGGAGVVYWQSRHAEMGAVTPAPVNPVTAKPASLGGPAIIDLSPDALSRAGIIVEAIASGQMSDRLRVPGRIEADAYKQVSVTPITAGRITDVHAEQGANVTRGQVLAQLYSPEVADQQRQYLSMRADLDTAVARLNRTERLVAIGSGSQQELEIAKAEQVRHATDVESARSRLSLMGVNPARLDSIKSAADISATVDITAQTSGVVTRRNANIGQNVDPGVELFGIADLSSVWVIADLYERDLPRVHIGSAVTVTSAALGAPRTARVTYVDPTLAAESRTVRVRAEVPNQDGRLRLGSYVDVEIEATPGPETPRVPKSAVQTINDRHFVYVADPDVAGRFAEREVHLGPMTGDLLEIVDGLSLGERVVTTGSFFLRAERDRLGLPLPPIKKD